MRPNANFATCIGIVKNNADPAQHGRLQVYIPSIDTQYYEPETLPWATYVSPFGGTTVDFPVGREQDVVPGISSYGLWAIPKVGAQVLCGFLEGDPAVRYWIGCVYIPQLNRTMPSNIDPLLTEIDDTGVNPQQTIPYQKANLTKAGLQPGSFHYRTRGGYERSISYPSNNDVNKPITNGYAPKPLQKKAADSQTICLTSPGRHFFVMSDVDEHCRMRLKTTAGSQIIFDDTNERIYISTAQGKNWIELDEGNGKIYLYSDSKISVRAKNDINLYSDENINIVANKRVNIKSETRSVNLEATHDIRLLSNEADILATASRDISLKTLNGPKANPIPEQMFCTKKENGLTYRWAEKGGSSTSSISFDSAQSVEARSMLNINMTSKSAFSARSMESTLSIQGGTAINIKADSAINCTAPDVGLVVIDGVEGQIPVFALNNADGATAAGSAAQVNAIQVVDHMVRPDHESWTRDEDEANCPTPRNKKYQG